jgi:hypothetical protein
MNTAPLALGILRLVRHRRRTARHMTLDPEIHTTAPADPLS